MAKTMKLKFPNGSDCGFVRRTRRSRNGQKKSDINASASHDDEADELSLTMLAKSVKDAATLTGTAEAS